MKISVITAAYNSEATIGDTLSSVARQTGVEVEHIVIDGASRDCTLSIVGQFSHVARVVSEPDTGIYDALNKGLALASGDVIGFLHTDDIYEEDDVLLCITQAFADPRVQAVYGDLVYVSKENTSRVVRNWTSRPFEPALLRWGWMPPHPTLYVRRSVFTSVGGFDTSLRISADYESVLRIFHLIGNDAVYIPRVLVRMRTGGASNRSIANILQKSREDLLVLRRHGVGGWITLVTKNLSKLRQF